MIESEWARSMVDWCALSTITRKIVPKSKQCEFGINVYKARKAAASYVYNEQYEGYCFGI